MDGYKEFGNRLRSAMGPDKISIYQGVVKSVEGITCTVTSGNIDLPDVRLRASETDQDNDIILVPQIGSAVIVGSLSGDLSQLVVLVCDKVDSIRVSGKITINGGNLGGLVNIKSLTKSLNKFVQSFNSHTHTGNQGTPTSPPTEPAQIFNQTDYEDGSIKH